MTGEFAAKMERVRAFLHARGADGIVISRRENFAYMTLGGVDYVNQYDEAGVVDLWVTGKGVTVIANRVETYRIRDEETLRIDCDHEVYEWAEDRAAAVRRAIGDKRALSDTGAYGLPDVSGDFRQLRYQLLPQEIDRLRTLNQQAALILQGVCRAVRPGMSEFEVAAMISFECLKHGMRVPVNLIAADERLDNFRHPIPTENKIRDRFMAVICAERAGLFANVTRLVSFSPLSGELRKKHEAVCRIDAAMIDATRPGVPVRDILQKGIDLYGQSGYADQWTYHHQGGPTGYGARDYLAAPTCEALVEPNQAFAWNPSIAGTKCEDTILATAGGPEILSAVGDWPTVGVEIVGRVYERADVLNLG